MYDLHNKFGDVVKQGKKQVTLHWLHVIPTTGLIAKAIRHNF